MQVTLLGAAGEVTGSAYHVQTRNAHVLVDFGLFQGTHLAEEKNIVPDSLNVSRLDAVVITHGHLDHVGRLPLLARRGFNKLIHATPATIEVTNLILRDSAKIQEGDALRANRKRERAGEPPVEPLYNLQDVEQIMACFRPLPYEQTAQIAPGVRVRLVEAGHILGSASIRMSLDEEGRQHEVVFSGDLGQSNAPLMRDPQAVNRAHTVFLESTYGDRDHRSFVDTIAEMTQLVGEAVKGAGKILVPSFAVGRTQTVLHLLTEMFHRGDLERFPIYVDSPMAIEATRIYQRHPDLMDEATRAALCQPGHAMDLDCIRTSVTAEDSKQLNDAPGPCLILAGAGMCNGGRILHHLRNNLWRPEATVLIVGYQAIGSLGRLLLDGAKSVSIFGERVAVKARVRGLGGLSAHAGQSDLLRWYEHMAHCKPTVVLTHGEARGREPLARLLRERHGVEAKLPELAQTIQL